MLLEKWWDKMDAWDADPVKGWLWKLMKTTITISRTDAEYQENTQDGLQKEVEEGSWQGVD